LTLAFSGSLVEAETEMGVGRALFWSKLMLAVRSKKKKRVIDQVSLLSEVERL
jgi:hypothetical protein